MKKINFNPSGVCCREMNLEVDKDNKILDIDFIGGCPGNMLGLKQMLIGQNALEIADKLKDVRCGNKSTSCPAELSKAIKKFL
ncbi:MAG: TIGR03905 family TSCPD domain-containing protein [Clostridium perfringens]|nr:TIGR03905 family TSCPD domain-containing protein [Clostridium perfringens]